MHISRPLSAEARRKRRLIVMVYAIVAGGWIALSSSVLGLLADDGSYVSLELAKGLAFVAVTALLLAVLVSRAFAALDASQERLSAAGHELSIMARFPDLAPTPVVQLGRDGTARYMNTATRRAAESAPSQKLLPPGYREVIERCLASGEPVLGVMHELDDRTWSWTFIPDPEYGVVYAYAVERTEELRLAEGIARTARMEAAGQLAAGVAHDFNNVLQAIAGHASLLRMDARTEEARQDIDEILAAVERAGLMVRRMLDFGRKGEGTPEPLDLAKEMRNLSGLWRHLLPKAVDLHVQAPPHPALVRIEASELDQLMTNLVANAGDAMRDGGRLEITVEVPEEPAGVAEIRVTDTGVGMTPEVLANAFEPFFTTKGREGTGLGLAQVRAIVERRGGALSLQSEQGQGTSFCIQLPLAGGVKAAQRTPEGAAPRKT